MKSPEVDFLFNLYARMAPRYDLYAQLLPLLGFRQMRYRTVVIDVLHLRPRGTVVDVG